MALVISFISASVLTVLWYSSKKLRRYLITVPMFMLWGASIMWTVDAIFNIFKLRSSFFKPSVEELLNDLYLGLFILAVTLVVWAVIILIKDPDDVIKNKLFNKKDK